jgi:hypothetical protein
VTFQSKKDIKAITDNFLSDLLARTKEATASNKFHWRPQGRLCLKKPCDRQCDDMTGRSVCI